MPAVYLVMGVLGACLGYREARNFRDKTGRAPWGWDPAVWGGLVFFSGLLIGGVLLCIARRTTKPEQPVTWSQIPAQPAAPAWATPVPGGDGNPYATPQPTITHPGSQTILPG